MAGAGGLSALRSELIGAIDDALPDAPCVVALSGGADSAVCGWGIKESGRPVRAVSIDHGLAASAALMDASAAIAARLGIDHTIVAAAGSPDENALREARYAALDAAAAPNEVIAVGHTADDQAETVLAHLLRGSGAAGAAGMSPVRGRLVRPMLGFRRADLRELAVAEGLPFLDDPENEDRSRLRNRIRHEVLPLIRESVNPAADAALLRTARLLAADERHLAGLADGIPLREVGSEIWIPVGALAAVPPPIAARVVRRALRRLLAPHPGSEADVRNVLRVAAGGAASLPFAGGHLVTRQGPFLALHSAGAVDPPDPGQLPVPGSVVFGRWVVEASLGRPRFAPIGRRSVVVADPGEARLRVRGAVAGDRVGIGAGTKPVADALYEAGIPPRLRPGWPIVEADGRMIWIAGIRPAAAALPAGNEAVITLRLKEAP